MSIQHEDLKGTVLPHVSLDEFEPKAGNNEDVIVVAFYLTDEPPAQDLNTFIQRSAIDCLDVEVSPNTDEDGNYLVFVELARNDMFPNKLQALIKDVSNVAGKLDWEVTTYLAGERTFQPNDPAIYKFLITNPAEYKTKDEFMSESMYSNVFNFLAESAVKSLDLDFKTCTISAAGKTIVAEVVDIGNYHTVFGRNFLTEAAFSMRHTFESSALSGMLAGYEVMPINEMICISNPDNSDVLILKNVELKY